MNPIRLSLAALALATMMGADCRTATECFGSWYVCLGRLANGPLRVECGAVEADVSCVLPPTDG